MKLRSSAQLVSIISLAAVTIHSVPVSALAADPYATTVVSYDEGANVGSYNDPYVALGEPTRYTGGGIHPAVVSAFNSPWMETEIVSIGPGGHLTVKFDSPILNDPTHPFGIDLLIFNNTMFFDVAWPSGVVGGLFSDDGGEIEVSQDGETWHFVRRIEPDGMFPTIGYLDAGPYDVQHGRVLSDFRKPVNPALTFDDFLDLSYEQVLVLYDGSGGGAGVDISVVGLEEASYVRISNPVDALLPIEIDAFMKVRPALIGDLDGNGVVNVFDLLILLSDWGFCIPKEGSCAADLDGNGVVNVFDLLMLLANWG